MKYLAWAERVEGQPCPERWDTAVRESAKEQGVRIDPKCPTKGWVQGNHTGGQVSVSNERFAGAFPAWIWEA